MKTVCLKRRVSSTRTPSASKKICRYGGDMKNLVIFITIKALVYLFPFIISAGFIWIGYGLYLEKILTMDQLSVIASGLTLLSIYLGMLYVKRAAMPDSTTLKKMYDVDPK